MRFLVFILLGCSMAVSAQKEFAKPIIDTLCTPYFFGRGYAKDGVGKAAVYLQDQLKNMGIKPAFNGTYFQPFDHTANIFSGETQFAIGKKYLDLGEDFIQDPGSGSFNEIVRTVNITLPNKLEENFVRGIYEQYPEKSVALCISYKNWKTTEDRQLYKMVLSQGFPLVVCGMEKLTWGASTNASVLPTIFTKTRRISNNKLLRFAVTQTREDFRSKNVAGVIKGSEYPDRYIVISAHYDHLGGLDNSTFIPGANDNASGTAMVLNLAKKLKENPPKYSVMVTFFAGEELGLLGSKYFVDKQTLALKDIKFVLNLDLLGTGDDGFAVVNGTVFPDFMEELNRANELLEEPFKNIKLRGEAANSDHYWFSKKGVPSFFIYTMGGISAYHDINDKAKTLPLTKYNEMLALLSQFVYQIP